MPSFMQLAIEEAREGIHAHEGGPFGTVIVKGGVVVGKGHNEVLKRHDPTCHGEIMAIRDACANLGTHDLSGCVLYTTGEPCPMCFGAILWANIDKVYYGCNVSDTEKIGFRDEKFYEFGADAEKKGQFLTEQEREACLALYEEYLSIPDTDTY